MDEVTLETHLATIDEQGYTIVEDAMGADLNARLRSAVTRLEDELAIAPKGNRAEGFATKRMYNLLSKDPVFWEMPVHENVLPLAERVLDKWCLLSGTTAMNIGPGEGLQGLHSDEGGVTVPRPRIAFMCTTIWALSDFTEENGATRLVPGSHRADREPDPDEIDDAIAAEMPAGSVLVMHGGTWHCGGPNSTEDQWRMGANIQYCQGWMRQQQNPYFSYDPEIVRKFPKRLQQLCGFGLYKGAMGHADGRSPGAIIGASDTDQTAYAYSATSR